MTDNIMVKNRFSIDQPTTTILPQLIAKCQNDEPLLPTNLQIFV